MDEEEIKWRAPEFQHHEKSATWNAAVVLIGILIIGIALWQRNFLVAVIAIIGDILVIYWGHKKPDMLAFTLKEQGLDIDERKSYPFESLVGFAILDGSDREDMDELVLERESTLNTYLTIHIPKDKRSEIESLLETHLPVVAYEESAIESIARWLKF